MVAAPLAAAVFWVFNFGSDYIVFPRVADIIRTEVEYPKRIKNEDKDCDQNAHAIR